MSERVAVKAREVVETIADVEIRATVMGEGPPLLYLHHSFGYPPGMELHDRLAEQHQLFVLDIPGFGGSQRPEWARHVRDLALLVGLWIDRRELGPASLVGCGFGGWLAAELATMSPSRVESLVLVAAAGLLPDEGRIADQMLVSHSAYTALAFQDAGLFQRLYGAMDDDQLIEWDLNREMVARVSWKPYMYNRRLASLLPAVDARTLVVAGGSDRVMPVSCAERYAALIPNARLEVLDGVGHAIDFEAPDELAALVAAHVANADRVAI